MIIVVIYSNPMMYVTCISLIKSYDHVKIRCIDIIWLRDSVLIVSNFNILWHLFHYGMNCLKFQHTLTFVPLWNEIAGIMLLKCRLCGSIMDSVSMPKHCMQVTTSNTCLDDFFDLYLCEYWLVWLWRLTLYKHFFVFAHVFIILHK